MLKTKKLVRLLWEALHDFFAEEGVDKATIIAYYSIFSSLFLITFFIFFFARFMDSPGSILKSVYPFSEEVVSTISPELFRKALEISTHLKDVGMVGIVFFLFLGSLVIKKIVQFVNEMFHVNLKEHKRDKGFLIHRVREFSLLMIVGALTFVAFLGTSILATLKEFIENSQFMGKSMDPRFTEHLNGIILFYIMPILMSFLFLFILYKWIPEKKVYLRGAVISALITALFWELTKRLYTYYLVRVSIIGQIHGPVMAIILFGFWMEISMAIMLYGAKLTFILDREKRNETA